MITTIIHYKVINNIKIATANIGIEPCRRIFVPFCQEQQSLIV